MQGTPPGMLWDQLIGWLHSVRPARKQGIKASLIILGLFPQGANNKGPYLMIRNKADLYKEKTDGTSIDWDWDSS